MRTRSSSSFIVRTCMRKANLYGCYCLKIQNMFVLLNNSSIKEYMIWECKEVSTADIIDWRLLLLLWLKTFKIPISNKIYFSLTWKKIVYAFQSEPVLKMFNTQITTVILKPFRQRESPCFLVENKYLQSVFFFSSWDNNENWHFKIEISF